MKRFLVIGNPIEHSLSPTLHNYWIKSNGIDAIYEKQKLDDGELSLLIEQLKKGKIDGVNVTVPHKKAFLCGTVTLTPSIFPFFNCSISRLNSPSSSFCFS